MKQANKPECKALADAMRETNDGQAERVSAMEKNLASLRIDRVVLFKEDRNE